MAQSEPLNFEQPKNDLSSIAEMERKKLLTKNDYNLQNNYSSVNNDALANGDAFGKGTGEFLDVYNQNAGAAQDIAERKKEIVINILIFKMSLDSISFIELKLFTIIFCPEFLYSSILISNKYICKKLNN
jgi:hypothetical protein